MTELLIILTIYSIFITAMYISNKLGPNKSFNQLIEDVKRDLTETASNIGELVVKAKGIVFDSQFTDAIKEFILIVEEKNALAKSKGEIYLKGDQKQLEVVNRLTGWVSNLTGSAEQGVFIELLTESELPADLAWAERSPKIAGAFARFAAVIDRAGRGVVPEDVRDRVVKHVQAWDGKEPGLGRQWVEEAVSGLDEKSKDIGRLVLLTALAPYQVDEGVVNAFTTHVNGDDRLLGALAWGSFTAVRRIGTWLGESSR